MLKFTKRRSLRHIKGKTEAAQSYFIPYKGHFDKNIVITKDKDLLIVFKVEGFSFETADDEDLDIKKTILNTLYKSIAGGNFALYFHIVRKRDYSTVDGEFEGTFSKMLDHSWKKKTQIRENFKNDIYITVVHKKDNQGTAGATVSIMNSAMKAADKELEDQELVEASKTLKEIMSRLMGSLKSYKPQLLGIRETDKGSFSEVLEFFALILNGGVATKVLVPTIDADKYISKQRLYFGKRAIEVRDEKGRSRFGGGISIKEYPASTNVGMLDSFLKLPFEMIITHSFVFANRAAAITSMQLQQNRMRSAGDKSISQMQELTIAMDMAQSGEIAFGEHHMSVFVFQDDLDRLDVALSLCYSEIVNAGVSPAREGMSMQATFWAQLPGNFKYIARGSRINTLNLAGLCSLHNYPSGKAFGNHWGPAVTTLDTTSGTPFFFNFHVRDVGHSMIIGPTGAGKTVLMNFLCAQSQKYKPRMFFFDKDRGAELFIRGLGGVYSTLDPSGKTGFNPLQLEDNSENRLFIGEWIKALASHSGKYEITPEDEDKINIAVEGNYKLPKSQRRLTNIIPFLGLDKPGSMASRMRLWHSDEVRSGVFDNIEDSLDFSKNRVFGFEMAPVLDAPETLGPILLYLFHKINLSLDGTPTMIVLDEAWALIDNEIFAPKIKDWLKVLRKLNAMVIFATQSVEDISKSRISETLVQQTATQIFLPNLKGTSVYQDVFKLSNREFALIKHTDPGSRYFLVKQGEDSVIARVDLSGMDDIINILSGRNTTVNLLDKIIEEVGDNPDIWIPIFLERVKKL
jgi:type IV secretion system protein VirB4